MTHTLFRTLAGAAGLTLSLAATAAPVVIDTPQKAAAASITAHAFFLDPNPNFTLPRQLLQITFPARDLVVKTLSVLAQATTPDDLTTMRGGLTIPCPHGGTLTGRLSRSLPVIAKFEWTGCVMSTYLDFDDPLQWQTFNGTGQIELPERTFVPDDIASLRLGTATADVTAESDQDDENFTGHTTRHMNLRMAGLIPLTRSYGGIYSGDYDFTATGSWSSTDVLTTHIPGIPPDTATYVNSFAVDGLDTRGTWAYDPAVGLDEDMYVEHGTFTMTWVNNAWPHPGVYVVSPRDLHLRTVTDYATATLGTTLDGRADVTWPAGNGPGCLNGTYNFRTDKLLELWNGWGTVYKAGALNINGKLNETYSTTYTSPPMGYPPAPSGTVLHEIKRVGTAAYPYEWNPSAGLTTAAQCFN